jgi:hypothetical protein
MTVAFAGKAISLTLVFASNFFLFLFSMTSNFFLSFSCSLTTIFFVYIVVKGCIEVVTELTERFTDYEALHLFVTKSIKSLGYQRNLLSLLEEVYKTPCKGSEAQLKIRGIVGGLLYKKILKVKKKNPSGAAKLSSPLTRLVFSLLEKLDSFDEASLKNFMTSLHDLTLSLYLNAKKLRELIAVERLKHRVLQIAFSMTLGFVIKTFFVFTRFSYTNLTSNVLTFVSLALLSITIFTTLTCAIQLRHPSFKDLTLCFTLFAALACLPLNGWV